MTDMTERAGLEVAALVRAKGHPRPPHRPCDDVVEVLDGPDGVAVLVADGATGAGEGWVASTAVAETFRKDAWSAAGPGGLARLLSEADSALLSARGGDVDTTAVAVTVRGLRLCGASAGDSEAHLVRGGAWTELTAGQRRKPRIGNGARPAPFEAALMPGDRLLVASDGLWGQVARDEARAAFEGAGDAASAVEALAALLAERHPRGLPDDLALVAVLVGD